MGERRKLLLKSSRKDLPNPQARQKCPASGPRESYGCRRYYKTMASIESGTLVSVYRRLVPAKIPSLHRKSKPLHLEYTPEGAYA